MEGNQRHILISKFRLIVFGRLVDFGRLSFVELSSLKLDSILSYLILIFLSLLLCFNSYYNFSLFVTY